MLRRRLDAPIACEPRHHTWFMAPADALMQLHSIARVAADPACCDGADSPGGDLSRRYWRWHGSPRMYYSGYSSARIAGLAEHLRQPAIGTNWVVFDNTAHGHATPDALQLKALLARTAMREHKDARRA